MCPAIAENLSAWFCLCGVSRCCWLLVVLSFFCSLLCPAGRSTFFVWLFVLVVVVYLFYCFLALLVCCRCVCVSLLFSVSCSGLLLCWFVLCGLSFCSVMRVFVCGFYLVSVFFLALVFLYSFVIGIDHILDICVL